MNKRVAYIFSMGQRQRYPLGFGFSDLLRFDQRHLESQLPSRFVKPGPLVASDSLHSFFNETPGSLGRIDWTNPDIKFQQSSVVGMSVAQNISPFPPWWRPRVKPRGMIRLGPGIPEGPIEEPIWLKWACGEEKYDIHEFPTWAENNPRILKYIASIPRLADLPYKYRNRMGKMVPSGYAMGRIDETPWCACFVNWCLKKAGMKAPGYARAQAWTKYGTVLKDKDVKVGAIAIIYHTPRRSTANMTTSGWHVGFYIGGPLKSPVLLGGNQGDSVCRKPFRNCDVYYRWPIEPDTDSKK